MTRLGLLLRLRSLLRAGYSSFSSSTSHEIDLQKTITVIGPAKFMQGVVAHYAAIFNYTPLKKTIKVSANSGEPSFFAPDNVLWSLDGMTIYFTLGSGNPVPHTLYVADCLAPALSDPFPYTVTA